MQILGCFIAETYLAAQDCVANEISVMSVDDRKQGEARHLTGRYREHRLRIYGSHSCSCHLVIGLR